MKKFTGFLMALLMSMTLVACGGGGGGDLTLDTSSASKFSQSFDSMYEELSDTERADLLYYFPAALYNGPMAEAFFQSLGMAERPSDEVLLSQSVETIKAYKIGCRALLNLQAKSTENIGGHNLKELNGVTAAEIIKKGKAAFEAYRKK